MRRAVSTGVVTCVLVLGVAAGASARTVWLGGHMLAPPASAGRSVAVLELPVEDGAVGELLPGDTVADVVNEPLPEPVEDVVESSPVAPVRDEVRRIVNQTTGRGSNGGGGSGGNGSNAGGSATGGSTGGGTVGGGSGTANGGSGDSATGGSGRGGRAKRGSRSRARRGAALRRAAGATPGRGGVAAREARKMNARSRGTDEGDESASAAAIRRIETIVKAVPTAIWIALGLLSLIVLALSGRTVVERRNARALARDREQLVGDVAALERALLPAVPERLGAVAASVAYRSCAGPAAGGDFYDAFELPGGRAAVIVGDVSGHGPDALEGTNSVRAQLHALLETGVTPRAAIAMVGEHSPVQLAGRFSTVVVAVHDPAEGTLTYATAGHAPPIIVGPAAQELLSAGASPPIGVGLRTGLRETTVALPPGSTCCFYTDGLVEAKTGDGMIGRERFAEMVAELGPDDQADVLLERVLAEADDASDDMAVCVLRPVLGAQVSSPRVEVLELDSDDVESGFAACFLGSYGVPARERTAAVERARTTVGSHGVAVLEVAISDGVGRAAVTAPADAPAPPAAV